MTDKLLKCKFTIDPKSQEFGRIKAESKPGDGFGCLIASYAKEYAPGKRTFAHLDDDSQTISITHGGYRWTRKMTSDEYALAMSFDQGTSISSPVTVHFNLADGTWTPHEKAPNKKNRPTETHAIRPRNGPKKSRRQRHRDIITKTARTFVCDSTGGVE